MKGYGRYVWPNGDCYEGEWRDLNEYKDNAMDGHGTYIWSDGRKYVGEWKDGLCHGHGTLYAPDGSIIYTGEWEKHRPKNQVVSFSENSSNSKNIHEEAQKRNIEITRNNNGFATVKKTNSYCLTGFILGIFSIFVGGVIGIVPILSIIFSAIGISKFDKGINKGKWQGIVGLILGILYTLVNMYNYGHIR